MLSQTNLQHYPEAFTALVGLPLHAFVALVEEIRAAHDSAVLAPKQRPDRKRAIGGGRRPVLSLEEAVLATLIAERFRAPWEVRFIFGVGRSTISRTVERLRPILATSSASGALVVLTIPERQERFLRAISALLERGGLVRHLGRPSGIWIDDDGKIWPYGRVFVTIPAGVPPEEAPAALGR